ncbi:hypothetical protein ACCT30_44055, partial [Rhizobium ruizarguesonis]
PKLVRLFTTIFPNEVLGMPSVRIHILFRVFAQPYIAERRDAVLAAVFDQPRHHLEDLQMTIPKRHIR